MLFIIIFVSVFLGTIASYWISFMLFTNKKIMKLLFKRFTKTGMMITEEVQNEITEGLE